MKLSSISLITSLIIFSGSMAIASPNNTKRGVWSVAPADYTQLSKVSSQSASSEYVIAKLQSLKNNKNSEAAPRLFAMLGSELYTRGYFSEAIDCYKTGWETFKASTAPDVKMFADLCAGELSQMYARIGEKEKLQDLFDSFGDRRFVGQGSALIDQSLTGLKEMRKVPQISFKCGPYALRSILTEKTAAMSKKRAPYKNAMETIENIRSTPVGFSLEDVSNFSRAVGLNYNVYKIESDHTPIPVPSVVHWKLNHFAAIIKKQGDRYVVADPTFGGNLLITEEAIRHEMSGYFLFAEGDHPGFSTVDQTNAKTVRGKGNTGGPNMDGYGDDDVMVPASCPALGMPKYRFHVMQASLRLEDVPISYTPPYGPKMDFEIHYNQRDVHNPLIYNVSSFGHNWTFNWFSYVKYDKSGFPIQLATPGGGGVKFLDQDAQKTNGIETFESSSYGQSEFSVVKSAGLPTSSVRIEPDGTRHEYGHPVYVNSELTLMLLTKVVDHNGNAVTIAYDSDNRITTITDAAGGVSTLCYNQFDSYGYCLPLISSITDPYGRTAYFHYDSIYRLTSITDTLGLTSSFTYEGDGAFVKVLSTPYGDTTFTREPYTYDVGSGDDINYADRFIEAEDPTGAKERVESTVDRADVANLYQSDEWPNSSLIPYGTDYLNYRNSLYWSKKAMAEAPKDPASAVIYHFLHTNFPYNGGFTSRFAEKIKKPLEAPVCYYYPGQSDYYNEGSVFTGKNPSLVGRLLDDGQTQVYKTEYNAVGNATEKFDPAGRRQVYTYAANGIDVVGVSVQTSSGGALTSVSKTQYDSNNRPTNEWDEAGAETVTVYDTNGWGLPVSVTNAKLETTTFDYTTTGLLKRIISPDTANYTEFEYGKYDQVTSVTKFPEGYTLRYERDVFDRLTKVVYPDNTSEKYVYDKLDLKAKRDRLGHWTRYDYNANRQKTAETNAAGEETQYSWCGCGALDALIDAEGRVTNYYYDIQSRLTSMTLPMTPPKVYEYEALSGRLKTVTDPKGQKRQIAYNIDNTIQERWVEDVAAGTSSVSPVTYEWDPYIKRVSLWVDNYGTTTLTYNQLQGVTAQHPGAGQMSQWNGPFTIGPFTNGTLTYSYDILGRLIDSSEGAVTYDNLGRVESIVNDLDTFTYNYMPHSTISTGFSSVNGGETVFDYKSSNQDFQLNSIKHYNGTAALVSQFDYDSDAEGRITEWDQKSLNGAYDFDGSYEYDSANRLSGWNMDNNSVKPYAPQSGVWNWRFDKAGNRLSQQLANASGVARTLYNINEKDQITTSVLGGPLHLTGTLDRPGQILSTGSTKTPTALDGSFKAWIDAPSGSGPVTVNAEDFSGGNASTTISLTVNAYGQPAPYTYTYDANGNMTSRTPTAGGATTTYKWDARDRLVKVSNGSTILSEYEYDGLGRRVRIHNPNGTTEARDWWFVWDGLRPVSAYAADNDGGIPLDVKYFDQGYIFLRDGEVQRIHYAHKDHLGSERNGFAYDAYGNLTKMPFEEFPYEILPLYTGHLYDDAAGLYLAPYRAYDPKTGRWLSREPLGLDGPNLYHYVFNDPVYFTDPNGLQGLGSPGNEFLPNPDDLDRDGIPNDMDPNILVPFGDNFPYEHAIPPAGAVEDACFYGFWGVLGGGMNGGGVRGSLAGGFLAGVAGLFDWFRSNPEWGKEPLKHDR